MLNCWWSRLRAVVGNDEPPPPPPPTEVPPTEPTPPAPGPPVPPDRSLARVMPGWPCWGLSNRMILTFFHHLPGHHPMFLFGGGTRSFSFLIYPFSFEFRSISEDFCDFCRKKRSSKFLIGLIGFPAIFDRWKFFSNFKFPSRFYQISIRIFPLSFKFTKVSDFFSKSSCVSDFGSKLEYVRWIDVYLFIYFCFLILFCENVTLSGLLFLQVIWFSRIKSASQMSRLIFNYSCSVQLFRFDSIFEFIRGYVDFLATSTNDFTWQTINSDSLLFYNSLLEYYYSL